MYGSSNVVIKNNYLKDVGGDAITTMYCYQPLVEANVSQGAAKDICHEMFGGNGHRVAAGIWPWKCKDSIFQRNECFDMQKKYPAPLEPKLISDDDGVRYEAMIDDSITTSFNVRTVTLNGGSFVLDKGAAVYVVTEGEGIISGDGYEKQISKGDYFLMPESAKEKYSITGDNIRITECFA